MYMCVDWFSSPRGKNMKRLIPGLRVRFAIFSPRNKLLLESGTSFPGFRATTAILNSPPDWLKITSAILDLENNRVYCSRNNSLLSFSAPDWLRVIWASYSSNENNEKRVIATNTVYFRQAMFFLRYPWTCWHCFWKSCIARATNGLFTNLLAD